MVKNTNDGQHHRPAGSWSEHEKALAGAVERHRKNEPVWKLFDRRVRSHHEAVRGLPVVPVAKGERTRRIARALDGPESAPAHAIYIHIPFCHTICSFCAFFRQPKGEADLDSYVDAVCHQLVRYGRSAWANSKQIDSVYLGGGTPTVLSHRQLGRILSIVREHFPVDEQTEITVETRCGDLTKPYWKRLRAQGVNRVSLGVQTFDTGTRRAVGRRSSTDQIQESIGYIHDAGISSISVDLIYNLPHQNIQLWRSDFDVLRSLPVSGASVYALIPFPRSTLMRRIAEGKESPLGGVEEEHEYFKVACGEALRVPRWKRFSPFHFGDASRETNKYNSSRAGNAEVLGVGTGAGGSLGGISFMNMSSVEDYCQAQTEGSDENLMVFESPGLSSAEKMLRSLPESLTCRMRDLAIDSSSLTAGTVESLLNAGLLTRSDKHLRVTNSGCFWTYNLSALLTASIAEDLRNRQNSKRNPL